VKAYVIDDQRAIVELLILLLSDMSVQAEGTTAPRQAHAAIVALQPHLILLDIMMPEIDGLTLLEELQRDPRTAAVPVVLCTAAVLSPSQSRLFADRGIGILSKPFDLEQLRAIVDAVGSRQ
jgi:CheY-like chemotaxis protein